MRLLLHWIVSAVALILTAKVVPGFEVHSFTAALFAAVVIGFVNATLGLLLKILTFPFAILTLGIVWVIINALMLKLAAAIVPGFTIHGFWPAFWGAIVMGLIGMIVHSLMPRKQQA